MFWLYMAKKIHIFSSNFAKFMSLILENWKIMFLPKKCVDLARLSSKCAFIVIKSDFLAFIAHSFCSFYEPLLFFKIIRISREYSRIIVEIIRIFANNEKRE